MIMLRVFFAFAFMTAGAQAETKPVAEVEAEAAPCDTCLARQNGKRALREYLAKKRAEEEAETQGEEKTDE